MKYISLLLLLIIFSSCKEELIIIDKPIDFKEKRKQLTLAYLLDRYGLEQQNPDIIPKMIVLHWTQIKGLENSFNAFKNETLANFRPDINKVSGLNVSSHFLVDQDGTIYRLMPEKIMARHVIGLNHCALGIENVGGTKGQPLTKQQITANILLVEYLTKKYNIEYVIGHYQYTNFEGHKLWLEKDKGYRTVKQDPGEPFLNAVLDATKHLNFKKIPTKK